MRGSVTPVLINIADRLTGTLGRVTRSVSSTYRRTSSTASDGAQVLKKANASGAQHLLEETRTVRQPHPLRAQRPTHNTNYRPSNTESAMAARRLKTDVGFTGDMRAAVGRSSTKVFKMRSTDGELNIYKPIYGEDNEVGLPFLRLPGSLTSREIAAYRVDEILGFGRIPPTARTDGVIGPNGRPAGPGMIQQFVDSTPSRPVTDYPEIQQQQVAVLDYIIGSMDRHPGNYRTVDRGDHLDVVAIDHGRSFPIAHKPLEIEIDSDFVTAHKGRQLDPEVLDALHNADTDRLRAALEDAGNIHPNSIDGALARLEKVRELGRIPADVKVKFYPP
ncbi:hypothetical protein [Nocardia sp. NPDC002869]|uniref:hypothetical protein n=1 Tax=Nocardia sp. NPDC002869 TaxID=3161032 RepID=UPI00398CAE27